MGLGNTRDIWRSEVYNFLRLIIVLFRPLAMLQRQFTLEPDRNYPLYITAKQLWCMELELNWDDPDAFTLILLHSTSFHKETWEPTLQHFFNHIQEHRTGVGRPKIKCAWVIECPNHGESAALNARALQRPPFYRDCEFVRTRSSVFHGSDPRNLLASSRMRKVC